MAEWITTTNASADIVWQNWTTGSSAAGNGVIWGTWVGESTATTGAANPAPNRDQYRETEEQQQARLDREEQFMREQEAARQVRLREKEEAQQKAEELLRETLEKEQLDQYEKTKWFFIISQSGKRYRIRNGWIGNIDELNEEDLIVATYCIHPQRRIPIEDSMLTQKLMLEADEPRFLQIANKTTLSAPRPLAV